jgi:hypothetical protein
VKYKKGTGCSIQNNTLSFAVAQFQPPDTGVLHGTKIWKFAQFHRMPALSILPSPNDAHGHLSCTIGYVLRTFECARCDRISTRMVPTDPMKTGDARGWLKGELGFCEDCITLAVARIAEACGR